MESFETLYDTKQHLIYGALRYLKIYRNKDDYYQIGVLALWEASLHFDETKGTFDTYAYSMILGRLKTALTKANRYESRARSFEPADLSQMSYENTTDLDLQQLLFESYTMYLTPKQANVILERFLYNHDVKTVAKKLGISENAVKNRTRDAMITLRKIYK